MAFRQLFVKVYGTDYSLAEFMWMDCMLDYTVSSSLVSYLGLFLFMDWVGKNKNPCHVYIALCVPLERFTLSVYPDGHRY